MENAFWEYCLLISMVITIDTEAVYKAEVDKLYRRL